LLVRMHSTTDGARYVEQACLGLPLPCGRMR
jgi:hypothetical protein